MEIGNLFDFHFNRDGKLMERDKNYEIKISINYCIYLRIILPLPFSCGNLDYFRFIDLSSKQI